MLLAPVDMKVTIQDLPQMKRLYDASCELWAAVQIHKDHIAYLTAFDEWEDALFDLKFAVDQNE